MIQTERLLIMWEVIIPAIIASVTTLIGMILQRKFSRDDRIESLESDVKDIKESVNQIVEVTAINSEGIKAIINYLEPDINGNGMCIIKKIDDFYSNVAKKSMGNK